MSDRGRTSLWSQLSNTLVVRTIGAAVNVIRYAHLLLPILLAPANSRLGRYVRARPELLQLPFANFICASWDVPTKLRRALNHLETTSQIGGAFRASPSEVVVLATLPMIGADYRIGLHQAHWLFREGQLALSLWEGHAIIFSLAFSICDEEGRRVAYIGGIQGRPQISGEIDIMERYRLFTKTALGYRPRDFLVEVAKLLFQAIGVVEILAVSDRNHVHQYRDGDFALSYDDVWRERGGTPNGAGFYVLPPAGSARAIESIPPKKRSMYRKRGELLLQIGAELLRNLSSKTGTQTSPATLAPVQQRDQHIDPFKLLAYLCAAFVLSLTYVLGGRWIGIWIGLAFVYVAHQSLKQSYLQRTTRSLDAFSFMRSLPTPYRIGISAAVMATVLAFDVWSGGNYDLGRAFRVYLIPIFVSSIILGGRGTLVMLIACAAAIDFLHLEPKYSFALSSGTSVVDLLVYCVLACGAFLIPRLLLASLELTRIRSAREY